MITVHEDVAQRVERYGRLLLLERKIGFTGDGHILSKWLCDCGTLVSIAHSRVKRGSTISCGCYTRERTAASHTKHGGRYTPEYSSWMAMRRRCEDPKDKDYPRYGAVGIRVCALWVTDFAEFLKEVGPRPPGTTLDRINTRLGYEPGNVRWATPQEQGRNRLGTFIWHIKGGVYQTITDAALANGVSEHSVWRWVNGQYDKRRDRMTHPRKDCYVVGRYE